MFAGVIDPVMIRLKVQEGKHQLMRDICEGILLLLFFSITVLNADESLGYTNLTS